MRIRWEIAFEKESQKWDSSTMLKYFNLLDFTYYQNNPTTQTDLEWEYIENIYNFLQSKENRQWVSIEERSLELFYNELLKLSQDNLKLQTD